jgi:hypothetical protein
MWLHSYTMRHTVHVVFPVDFEGGEHVYWVHPINVQLLTDPVIMSAKEENGCDSGSESLDKHEPRNIVVCHVERRDQRRVWRYQRGNQNPYIEEEKTTEKVLKDKQRSTKHRYQTKDQATRTPLKPEMNSGAPHG